MNLLRRLPTRQLIGLIAGALVLAGSITAVATAAFGGSGPVPPAKGLATAVHDALTAPAPAGVSARISFTNTLVDTSGVDGASPLLTGASGRLWASADGRLRIELQSSRGDTQLIVAPGSFTLYDSGSNTAYEGTLPKHKDSATHTIPAVQTIQDDLNQLMGHLDVSGAIPSDVAGQPAYTVTLSPKHSGGLLGSAQLAWDAIHGAPLRAAIYAAGNATPVIQLSVTDISFGPVGADVFDIVPPSGVKVVKVATATAARARAAHRGHGHVAVLNGSPSQLPFTLDDPARLAGLPRTSVKLLDWGGKKAALVTYGQHLGAILVLERQASARDPLSFAAGALQRVQLVGATGSELPTALGTVISFQRGGISYLVAGSVPPVAAETAARGL